MRAMLHLIEPRYADFSMADDSQLLLRVLNFFWSASCSSSDLGIGNTGSSNHESWTTGATTKTNERMFEVRRNCNRRLDDYLRFGKLVVFRHFGLYFLCGNAARAESIHTPHFGKKGEEYLLLPQKRSPKAMHAPPVCQKGGGVHLGSLSDAISMNNVPPFSRVAYTNKTLFFHVC